MATVKELCKAVQGLNKEDLNEFTIWFDEYVNTLWNNEIVNDFGSGGKLEYMLKKETDK